MILTDFSFIIPIIVIGLIPVAKILIREAITSSVNHTPFTLSTVQILIISILSIAIFFAIALLICLKLKMPECTDELSLL